METFSDCVLVKFKKQKQIRVNQGVGVFCVVQMKGGLTPNKNIEVQTY